jgi:hypothetical protein
MFALLKAGAKVGPKLLKIGARSGKTLARRGMAQGRTMARQGMAQGRAMARQGIAQGRNMARRSMTQATNYLDAQKRRIFQTDRGAVYTNTSGGNRNYNPTPNYYNEPGSNVITPLNSTNRPNFRNNGSY